MNMTCHAGILGYFFFSLYEYSYPYYLNKIVDMSTAKKEKGKCIFQSSKKFFSVTKKKFEVLSALGEPSLVHPSALDHDVVS